MSTALATIEASRGTASLHTLDRVRTFCTGLFDEGTVDEVLCRLTDLQDVVRNFELLSFGEKPLHQPSIAKGHEMVNGVPGPDLTKRTDQPACGWVVDCWLEKEEGLDFLFTKWAGIPDPVYQQIRNGEYRFPSAEFYEDPAEGNLPGTGWCLRRVVILGATPPRNKRIGQLVPLAFGEDLRFVRTRRYRSRSSGRSYIQCFAEGASVMENRADLESKLMGLGFDQAQIDALKPLSDEDFAKFALAVLAAKAGAPAAPAAESPPASANAEMPPPEQMIADLLSAGVPQPEIDAVKDDPAALYALWVEKVQGATPPAVAASEPAGGAPVTQPLPKQIIHKFAEVEALKRQVAGMQRQTALLFSERERERKATRERTVNAHCERWVRDGYVLPGDVDPKSKTPNLYHRLMAADGGTAKKFGEKSLTDFDAAVAEIEARGPGYVGKFFSEKIASPQDTNRVKQVIEERAAAIKSRYAHATGKSLEERLGMLRPLSTR